MLKIWERGNMENSNINAKNVKESSYSQCSLKKYMHSKISQYSKILNAHHNIICFIIYEHYFLLFFNGGYYKKLMY